MAMLMIVLHHFTVYGQAFRKASSGLNFIGTRFYCPVGQVGVSLFVMITGYFLSKKKEISVKYTFSKAKDLWLEMFFYSIVLFVLSLQVTHEFTIKGLIDSLLPFVTNEWWFMTAYLMLLLLLPFLSRAIFDLTTKKLSYLLFLCLFFFSILPMLGNPVGANGNCLGLLACGYLAGCLLARWRPNWKYAFLGSIVTLFAQYIILGKIGILYSSYGILPFCLSFFIFILIIDLLPNFHSHFINLISGTVLATYLITEQPSMRAIIWHVLSFAHISNMIIVNLLAIPTAIGILIVCGLIDIVRKWLFNVINIQLHKVKNEQ